MIFLIFDMSICMPNVYILCKIFSMKHDMKNSKNPGFIEFVPVAVSERKGEIRKGKNGNLTITC